MADEQMDNETLGTDGSIALIEQFHESMNKRLKVVQDSEEKLRKEKEEMDALVSSTIKDYDIIKINVGYELIIGAKRSTLCLAEGSMFSNMFSGRWDDALTRDEENRVFIDEDPELIKTIVNFLRHKRREDPEKPFRFISEIPKCKREVFLSLLNYFGLTTFFYGASSLVSEAEVIQPHANRVHISKSENKIQLTRDDNGNEHHFLYLTPSLSLKDGDSWKVTVNSLPNGAWLLIGIIQNAVASQSSFSDGTCYGWTSSRESQCWFGGNRQDGHSGYTGFTQGDCLYFHITTTKLSMHSVQKNRTFAVDIANHTSPTYIHFNMSYSGTKVTVEALAKNELAAFQFNS